MILTSSAKTILDPAPNYCALQSNGIDLTIDKISAILPETFVLDSNTKEYCELETLEPDKNGYWVLPRGNYQIEYTERIAMPKGECAYIIPRSFFIRNGACIHSGLVDSGYGWRDDSNYEPQPLINLLVINGGFLKIKKGSRVAQLVIFKSEDNRSLYNGEHFQQIISEETNSVMSKFEEV